MIKIAVLSMALGLGLAGAANASSFAVPAPVENGAIIQVGEGCGAGAWRGPQGVCNRFYGPGGTYRGTVIECPPGFHIGPGRAKCWPNR